MGKRPGGVQTRRGDRFILGAQAEVLAVGHGWQRPASGREWMAGTDVLDSPLRPAALGGEGRAELEDACVDLKARASNDDLSARSSLALWEE